jgi:hypothetical protein
MELLKMLSDLRAELSQLEGAITVFERLATGQRKGRGRPLKWMSQAQVGPRPKKDAPRKRKASHEASKRTAAAQRKRMATAKKAGTASKVQ